MGELLELWSALEARMDERFPIKNIPRLRDILRGADERYEHLVKEVERHVVDYPPRSKSISDLEQQLEDMDQIGDLREDLKVRGLESDSTNVDEIKRIVDEANEEHERLEKEIQRYGEAASSSSVPALRTQLSLIEEEIANMRKEIESFGETP